MTIAMNAKIYAMEAELEALKAKVAVLEARLVETPVREVTARRFKGHTHGPNFGRKVSGCPGCEQAGK